MTDTTQVRKLHQPFIEWLEIAYGTVKAHDLAALPAELQKTMFPMIAQFGPAADSIIPFYDNITLLVTHNKHLTYPLTQYLADLGMKASKSGLKRTDHLSVEAIQLNERFLSMSKVPGSSLNFEVQDGIYAVCWVLSAHGVLPERFTNLMETWIPDVHKILLALDSAISSKGLRRK